MRRRSFIEEARREQIKHAAITSVNEVGYQRASLADIAGRVGIAKSAIAYYFDSKESLLLHLVDRAFTALGSALTEAVPEGASAATQLEAYADAYLSHVDHRRAEIAAAAEILVSHRGPDGVPLYLVEQEADTALLGGILRLGMKNGEFRELPLDVAAGIVESLLDRAINMVQRDATADLTGYRAAIVPFLVTAMARDGDRGEVASRGVPAIRHASERARGRST